MTEYSIFFVEQFWQTIKSAGKGDHLGLARSLERWWEKVKASIVMIQSCFFQLSARETEKNVTSLFQPNVFSVTAILIRVIGEAEKCQCGAWF